MHLFYIQSAILGTDLKEVSPILHTYIPLSRCINYGGYFYGGFPNVCIHVYHCQGAFIMGAIFTEVSPMFAYKYTIIKLQYWGLI